MMIEVNLLPAEFRRVEHTPLPRFLVIILGTAAVMATTAFGVIVNLRNVPDLEARQATHVRDIGASQPQAAVWDKLQDEIADAKERKQAIAEVWRTRILWSEKLSQLAQMAPNFIGFQEIKVDEPRASGSRNEAETGGMLTLESLCAGANLDRVADFRRIVEGQIRLTSASDPRVGQHFFSSFTEVLPTETTKVDTKQEEYVEKEALKFTLRMPVKAASARLGEALQAVQEEMNRQRALEKPAVGAEKPGRKTRPVKTEAPAKGEGKGEPAKPQPTTGPAGKPSAEGDDAGETAPAQTSELVKSSDDSR